MYGTEVLEKAWNMEFDQLSDLKVLEMQLGDTLKNHDLLLKNLLARKGFSYLF